MGESKRRPGNGAASTNFDGGKGSTPPSPGEPACNSLHGLELLAEHPDDPVVLVEGREAANALRPFTACVLGILDGANATPSRELLANLRGRDVYLWPINDPTARWRMDQIAGLLAEVGARVYTISWPEAPANAGPAELVAAEAASDVRAKLRQLADRARRSRTRPRATPASAPPPSTSSRVSQRRLAVVQVSQVAAEPVPWLWHGWIARGALTVVTGHPDVGKGWFTLALAAAFTRGWKLFGDPREQSQGQVLLLVAEDPVKYVVRPRLDELGADVTMVKVVKGTVIGDGAQQHFSLIDDLDALGAELATGNYVMVVIDPLNAYLGSTLDTNRDAAMRSVLTPLAGLAEKHGVAIVAIIHPTKGTRDLPLYRIQGSVANSAACRTALLVGRDKANDGELSAKRHVVLLKNNLMPDEDKPRPICFELTREKGFQWVGSSGATADDILGAEEEEKGALAEAKAFLRELLAEGPVASVDVFKVGRPAGFSEKTLRRAKSSLGAIANKQKSPGTFPAKSGWVWSLPPEDGQPGPSSGERGHLQAVTLALVDDNGEQAWRLVYPNGQSSETGLFATADAARQEAKARGWTIADPVESANVPLESLL